MLDILVVVSDTTPKLWVNQCLRSIRYAKEICRFPVNVVESKGVVDHIGQARSNGLKRCTNEYVAFVDDDDFVFPNAFTCLEKHFNKKPSAIFTREMRLLNNGCIIPFMERHHLTAYRREAIAHIDLTKFRSLDNIALMNAVKDEAVDELSWVYMHRMYCSKAQKLRALYADRERKEIK